MLKDTVNSCIEYRILGLAAEAAFFTLLSLPPLLLGMIGLLGYVDEWTTTTTVASIERNILSASQTVLSERGVNDFAKPLLADVTTGARPDVISIGFAIALWSGSRAVNVFIDTITVMYGLDGHRGIVKTRLLAFLLYVVALLLGAVVLPLLVVGPDRVVEFVPWGTEVIAVLYWPLVILLTIAFLTTLYHVSVPVRSPWIEDVPGALVALGMWVLGSFLLRIYLTNTVEGPTIYGSLAAPIARPAVDRHLRLRGPGRRRGQRCHRPGVALARHGRRPRGHGTRPGRAGRRVRRPHPLGRLRRHGRR
ncbi:integral membrane protein [Streptomyces filamentosus NRRL 15998]|uniref:Integral membrane protein n=1 Tax=Streptomyces filamentosus NRRL 15998 TaxID=457431 RepID=D6ABR7_STRFL|nr:integral membrane protein [Streptomyces filamentosus NRRL 15998]